MPHLLLGKILDGAPGVKKDGAAYLLSEEIDGNAFIALGHEVMQIPKLQRIEVAADLITLVTAKNERFYFPPDQIVGLRLGGPDGHKTRAHAGFSK